MQDGELVSAPYIYTSSAACIEGEFRLVRSHDAWLASSSSSSSSSRQAPSDSRYDIPTNFVLRVCVFA